MPKAIKKKVSKKDSDTEHDVQDRLQDFKSVIEKKQKTLVAYGLVALSAIIVISGIVLYRYNANVKAQQLEYDAYKTYYNLYQKTPLPAPEKAAKALELYRQAYEKKKSARLLLSIAAVSEELGKHEEALKALDDLTRRFSRDAVHVPLAYQMISDIQLRKGNRDEARKALDKITAAPGEMLKDAVLAQKARMLEQDGKKDEAKVLYKQLIETYPDSPYGEEAKARTAEKNAAPAGTDEKK